MFGISAAYIEATKNVTNPDMRKMIRYCITDVYITNLLRKKLKRNFFK